MAKTPPTHHGAFPVTRWSMVLALREGGDVGSGRLALDELCKIYWRPIYSYARFQGLSPADAEDMTQSFFSFVLEKALFTTADAALGKMRNYLLTAFSRHIKHWPEDELSIQPPDHRTPEMIYQRMCALRIIEATVEQLAQEQEAAGKKDQFQLLRPRLDPTLAGSGNDAELAARLGMTHDAVRQSISRLRKRFREIMRDLVAGTLAAPTDEMVQEELTALRNALVSRE